MRKGSARALPFFVGEWAACGLFRPAEAFASLMEAFAVTETFTGSPKWFPVNARRPCRQNEKHPLHLCSGCLVGGTAIREEE